MDVRSCCRKGTTHGVRLPPGRTLRFLKITVERWSMSWFRVHTGLLHNAKVQSLDPKLFKALVNLWCLAKDGEGTIPNCQVVAFQLRVSAIQARVYS